MGAEAGNWQASLNPLCSQWTGNHELEPWWTWVEATRMGDLKELEEEVYLENHTAVYGMLITSGL